MRVGSGEARGKRLKGPVAPGVRPTTERVRAAVFNILESSRYSDRRVLDLFAGTGSLGIEALSRGAAWADFVERDRRQCAVIRENLATVGYDGMAEVRQGDAVRMLGSLAGHYSLVMLDPPYRMGAFHGVLEAISGTDRLVEPGGAVVAGHSRHTELRAAYGALRRVVFRQYGDNAVSIYTRDPEELPEHRQETADSDPLAGAEDQAW